MFELVDYLIGIYKIDNCIKSIMINFYSFLVLVIFGKFDILLVLIYMFLCFFEFLQWFILCYVMFLCCDIFDLGFNYYSLQDCLIRVIVDYSILD